MAPCTADRVAWYASAEGRRIADGRASQFIRTDLENAEIIVMTRDKSAWLLPELMKIEIRSIIIDEASQIERWLSQAVLMVLNSWLS